MGSRRGQFGGGLCRPHPSSNAPYTLPWRNSEDELRDYKFEFFQLVKLIIENKLLNKGD